MVSVILTSPSGLVSGCMRRQFCAFPAYSGAPCVASRDSIATFAG